MKNMIPVFFLFLAASAAFGANDALSQASPAPLGERVAIYLQNMLAIQCAIWEQNHPVDMDYREEIHLAVSYEPSEKLIGVSVIGAQEDLKYVQTLLEKIQKTMLSFNKKIKGDYGIDLSVEDFSLAYLDTRNAKIILRLKNGTIVDRATPSAPEPTPTHSTEIDMTPKL
jgi:hypothetical protein